MSSIKLLLLFLCLSAGVTAVRAQLFPNRQIVPPPLEGGSPNKVTQIEECKELRIVPFSELRKVNSAAYTLLVNTYGMDAEWIYDNASLYYIAVLLNTAAASASIGTDFSGALILKPYFSEKRTANTSFQRLPFGYYFKGFKGIPTPPSDDRFANSDRYRDQGSVEVATDENGDTHFDVDLYSPRSPYYREHWQEVLFNEAYGRPTHPGDVVKQLYEDRKLRTGVSCKN